MTLLDDIRVRLEKDAYLFDDPAAYRAGVADALEQVRRQTAGLTAVPERMLDLNAFRRHAVDRAASQR